MFTHRPDQIYTSPLIIWHVIGVSVLASAVAFTRISTHAETDLILGLFPVTWVVLIGSLSGTLFLTVPALIRHLAISRATLIGMIIIGLASRLILFGSAPLWEIDYLRYLWDGSMVVNGLSPYLWSPEDILAGRAPEAATSLALQANGLVEQINYPHLRTIYPPLSQTVFAASHLIGEWSLTSWRTVLLVFDLASLGLLINLLRHLKQSVLWAAIYWWNPLVIQMFFNAAHMDALLVPFILGALLLTIRLRPVIASGMLALAVGIKLWPVLLLPSLLRHRCHGRLTGFVALCAFGIVSLLILFPLITTGLGDGSGLTAYATDWNRNSAFYGLLESGVSALLSVFDLYELDASRIVRAALAGVLIMISLMQARQESSLESQLCKRFLIVTAALFLLTPAAYPWYGSWVIAFLVLSPNPALLVWTATLPLYHLRFHPYFLENPAYFENAVVWLEHGPVMVLLLVQWSRSRRARAS